MTRRPDNASDTESLDIRKRLERRRDNRQRGNIKQIMSTEAGREFMWTLLDRCGIYRSSFTGNSETFFREGERNIGLYLTAQLNKDCVTEYAAMQREALKREEDERKELEPPEQADESQTQTKK